MSRWRPHLAAAAIATAVTILAGSLSYRASERYHREFAYHISDSDSVGFICFEGTEQLPVLKEGYVGWQEAKTCPNLWVIPTIPGADSPIEGVPTFMELLHNQPPTFDTVATRADDTCLIIYTS